MARNILVTGGAGFVGSHLVDGLLASGHRVRVFDNLTPQVHGHAAPDYLSPEAELVRGEMQDSSAVRRALDGVDVVFHMAAAVGVGQAMLLPGPPVPDKPCLPLTRPGDQTIMTA